MSGTANEYDRRMVAQAIALARRGEGRVEPNPMVGCVITRNGRILGRGYHRRFGGPHAEIEALRACTDDPRGAAVYVSMEPCCRHGKTPPCTDALIEARVRRVVIAVRDPSAAVKGRGLRALRAAGIKVDTGVCRTEGDELIAPFRTHVVLKRPYVIAKWAQSLDGRLAAGSGDSMWISCPTSRRSVHRLRARVDAVLVGSGTVLTDDPLLTARDVPLRRRAARVVLDGRLRIRTDCRLVHTANEHKTIVFTTFGKATGPKAKQLQRAGVEVVSCRARSGRLALREVLRLLARRDVTNLLVEGGPLVLTALLTAGLVDEAYVFTAPMLIGGDDAPGALRGRGAARVEAALTPRLVQTRRSGRDVLHHLRFT